VPTAKAATVQDLPFLIASVFVKFRLECAQIISTLALLFKLIGYSFWFAEVFFQTSPCYTF
jgi:hypothetical protein